MAQKDVNLKVCNNCGIGVASVDATRCSKCNCAYILQTADLYEFIEASFGVVSGRCSGHPILADGSQIRTSLVLKETDEFILTYNTLYMKRLGTYTPTLKDPLPYFKYCSYAEDNYYDAGSGD